MMLHGANMSDRVSEYLSDRMSESMSDRVSEYMSAINVR